MPNGDGIHLVRLLISWCILDTGLSALENIALPSASAIAAPTFHYERAHLILFPFCHMFNAYRAMLAPSTTRSMSTCHILPIYQWPHLRNGSAGIAVEASSGIYASATNLGDFDWTLAPGHRVSISMVAGSSG